MGPDVQSELAEWMKRVESKLDGVATALDWQRIAKPVEGLAPLARGANFERGSSSLFDKERSGTLERGSSSLFDMTPSGPVAAAVPQDSPRSRGGQRGTQPPDASGRSCEKEAARVGTPRSQGHEPPSPSSPCEDCSFDEDQITHDRKRGSKQDGTESWSSNGSLFRKVSRRLTKVSREQELMKRMKSEEFDSELGKHVKSRWFDCMVTLAIVLNSLVIGVEVQLRATSNTTPEWFDDIEIVFTMVFTVEIIMRLFVYRSRFLTDSDERWWNVFDLILIVAAWVDLLLNHSNAESGALFSKIGRLVRMFRIIRVIRTVRFISQLRVLLLMIMGTLQSLFWLLVILLGMIYAFSIILTQGATDYLHSLDNQVPTDHEDVSLLFGSLFQTMYTLFQCMSGGINWGVASNLMSGPGWVMQTVLVVFMFFTLFSVVNVVNGLFVDSAIELAKNDRMVAVQKQRLDDRAKETQLLDLLKVMDSNRDNIVTFEEFEESLKQEEIIDYFSALRVDIEDAKQFFVLLDLQGSGSVDIVQFVTGMERLRGEARSADLHIVLQQNRMVMTMLSKLVRILDDSTEVSY
ncbi:unnamed protein product [Prorocentrum cordatum]|uniref:EF-hand domain-containing protein n=1 Tax=Prorocentrum cordatum TaxID=2364126 RepID=A0ABN9V2Q6_9DINO|nr:unnamed protein product [Polarella glacialis]